MPPKQFKRFPTGASMPGVTATPKFHTLSREQCEVILAPTSWVGSPTHAPTASTSSPFTTSSPGTVNGLIYARTAQGTQLEQTGNNNVHQSWPAAFEVDEVERIFSWRSVVDHGSFHAAAPGNEGGGSGVVRY
jgi:hypothetical protein